MYAPVKSRRRLLLAGSVLALFAPVLATAGSPGAASEPESAEIALTWQSVALRTVPFSPAKGVFLSFTSEAADRAVRQSLKFANSSEAAAVAQAAHDVLVANFPAAAPALDTDLATSLAAVPDGPAQDRGVEIGAEAAAEQVASRVDDGRGDPAITYTASPGIGVWVPDPRPMAQPWYGFIDRLAGRRPVAVDGPDPVGSPAYRADLAEVQALGRAGADAGHAATASYFAVDAFALYRNALIAHLRAAPIGLAETTALFADLDTASGEALRQVWRLKYTVGYWRPGPAITSDDGDPQTVSDPTWTSAIAVPPYPEYPSGHGAVTGTFTETVRCHLGDIPLTLSSSAGTRPYDGLAALEQDAFMSRIYGGIHFRDAMEDSYLIGHTVAAQVCRR